MCFTPVDDLEFILHYVEIIDYCLTLTQATLEPFYEILNPNCY